MNVRARRVSALFAAAGCGAGGGELAHAQQFTNPGFQTGDLSGWTITATPNGTTAVQTVEVIDIDGPGPLAPSPAAKFSVGNIVTMTNHQAGIELTQMLELTEGVEYWIRFDWAATRGAGPLNPEGGVFAAIVDGHVVAMQSAGSTGPSVPNYGRVEGPFVPEQSGPHRVGARITRPFLPVPELYQWVDNFEIVSPPRGACCMHDGSCSFATAATCTLLDGAYRGDGIACTPGLCPIPGACCMFLHCAPLSAIECARADGAYAGHGVACASIPCEPRGIPLGLPPHNATFSSESISRGLWFQAPVDFSITGVRIPDPGGAGMQNFEIVRFPTYPPPSSAYATNDFLALARHIGISGGHVVPVNIAVRAGDVIGILGNRSEPGSLIMRHSTGDGAFVGAVLGEPVTLVRLSMESNLITAPATLLFSSAILGVTLARVEIYYAEAGPDCYANCDQSTTVPLLSVDDFVCFINAFAQALTLPHAQQVTHYANCDGSTAAPVLSVDDFTCFIDAFSQGCP